MLNPELLVAQNELRAVEDPVLSAFADGDLRGAWSCEG
jgi:hypothetical protein